MQHVADVPHASYGLLLVQCLSCVLLQQVYAQPIFEQLDKASMKWEPLAKQNGYVRRALLRVPYVCGCAIISAIMPFFTVFVGLIGAFTFWLPAVHMPIVMHWAVYPPTRTRKIWMGIIDTIIGLISALAIVSSMRGLVLALEHATFFGKN